MRHLTVSFGGGRLPATAHAMSLFCSWLCAVRLCCDRVFPFRLFLSLLPCSLVVVWHPLSDPQCLSLLAAIVPLVAVPAPCASHIQPSTASHRSRSTSSGRSNSLAMCSSRALRNLRICAETGRVDPGRVPRQWRGTSSDYARASVHAAQWRSY